MNTRIMNYYHNNGKMPDRYYYQQANSNINENLQYQRQKIYNAYEDQKKVEEIEKLLEEQMFQALVLTLDECHDAITEQAGNDVIGMISSAFSGGSIHPEALQNKTYRSYLAIMLGRMLGNLPFRLLEDAILDKGHMK